MTPTATLYVGVASPLVEVCRRWLAKAPEGGSKNDRLKLLRAFPHRAIGAYGLEVAPGAEALAFRTPLKVNPDRVKEVVKKWGGQEPAQLAPEQLPTDSPSPVSPLDHRRYLAELHTAFEGQPVHLVARVGLTLQVLQRDLLDLKPALVVLFCHGTKYGELLLEDGRGLASVVAGDRLFEAIDPEPRVLFLAACHSEAVLKRAKQAGDWAGRAIVSVDSDSKIEVTAVAEFQSRFFRQLFDGLPAGEAFDGAERYVAGSETVGDLTFAVGDKPASQKFRINETGREVKLDGRAAAVSEAPAGLRPAPRLLEPRLRRAMDRFVGRRWEMAQALNALLPLGAGLRGAADHRIVTLTKEGGIGKTALAAELSDWAYERCCFPAGVFEVSCEQAAGVTGPGQLLSRLLEVLGVPAAEPKGNLLELLQAVASARFPEGARGLLLLDNLDDLIGRQVALDIKRETQRVLETLLASARELRILATCRWPLDLPQHEAVVPVAPLSEEDSRDVFLSHVVQPAVALEVRETWEQEAGPIRQLIRLSGRHPQSLQLLAGQLRRPGMDLTKLRDEAHANLLDALKDPYAADDDDDRQLKVRRTFELSYRHLSEPARKLFARLSRLPAGICCGEMPEGIIQWAKLLGDDWKQVIEKELDYFSLGHFEDGPEGTSFFRMLPAMVELSAEKFEVLKDDEWIRHWAQFWQQRLREWNQLISGKVPEDLGELDAERRAAAGSRMQGLAASLFAGTKGNWRALFEFARENDPRLCTSLLLDVVPFLRLTGQRLLARELATQAVTALRAGGMEELLASALRTLGDAQSALGKQEAARAAYEEALKIYRRLAKQHPAAFEPGVAGTLNNLGTVQGDLGEREAARASFEEVLKIYRRLAEQHPAAFEPNVAATLNNLGNVQGGSGERAAARDSYGEALEIHRRLAEQHPAAFEPGVAGTLNNLGNVQRGLGERALARASFEEALKIYRRLAKQHPVAFEPDMAMTLNNLGNVQGDLGERALARASYEEALKIGRRLAKQHPAAFEPHMAMTLNNLGTVQGDLGEREAARASFEEALQIRRRLAKQHPAAFEPDAAQTLNNLGALQRELGEREAARAALEEALEIYWPLFQKTPQAYGQNLFTALRNYIKVAPEAPDDRWWQLWKTMQQTAQEDRESAEAEAV